MIIPLCIPTGMEGDRKGGIPSITIAIIVLSFFAFLVEKKAQSNMELKVLEKKLELSLFLKAHPSLARQEKGRVASRKTSNEALPVAEPSEEEKQEGGIKLLKIASELASIVKRHPLVRWSYDPQKPSSVTLITHIFVHDQFPQLLICMVLLLLIGPFMEHGWGKPLYAGFYLLSGVLSALVWGSRFFHPELPNYTAFGAVGGIVGAFAVRYAGRQVSFIGLTEGLRLSRFNIPVWLVTLLWVFLFIGEWFLAIIRKQPNSVAGHHVVGVSIGIMAGIVLKLMGVGKKETEQISPSAKIGTPQDVTALMQQAQQFLVSGNQQMAFGLMLQAAKARPSDPDITQQLCDLAALTGKQQEAAPFLSRWIERLLSQNNTSTAMTHYLDLRAKNIAPTLSPLAKLKVLETLLADKNHGEAESLSLQIMDEVKSGGWQPHLLVMLADVCFKMVEMGHREPALALLLHLRTRAELPTGKREEWSVRCDKLQKAA